MLADCGVFVGFAIEKENIKKTKNKERQEDYPPVSDIVFLGGSPSRAYRKFDLLFSRARSRSA